jgi:hypothetical protein
LHGHGSSQTDGSKGEGGEPDAVDADAASAAKAGAGETGAVAGSAAADGTAAAGGDAAPSVGTGPDAGILGAVGVLGTTWPLDLTATAPCPMHATLVTINSIMDNYTAFKDLTTAAVMKNKLKDLMNGAVPIKELFNALKGARVELGKGFDELKVESKKTLQKQSFKGKKAWCCSLVFVFALCVCCR